MNLKQNQFRKFWILGIIAAALLVLVTLGNIAFAKSNPGGDHFLVGWAGTRAFFTDGTSPYSSETSALIQNEATWITNPAEKNELRFVSPLYVIGLFAPFALVENYAVARGLWMTLLEICLIAIPFLTYALLRKRAPSAMIFGGLLLAVLSYPGILSLIGGNAVIIFAVILLLMLTAIDRGQDETAGILMAVLTMSMQNTFLVILFLLIWALRKHRSTILTWFAGTLVVLIGFSVLLIPNWPLQAVQAFIQLSATLQASSPGAFMAEAWGNIGLRLSIFLTVVLAGLMLREWFQAFNGNEGHFVWGVFLTLSLSQWIGIPTEPGNFILLIPGILVSLSIFLSRWGNRGKPLVYGSIVILAVLPWLLTWILPASGSRLGVFLVFPASSILMLYWTKWWAVSPVS